MGLSVIIRAITLPSSFLIRARQVLLTLICLNTAFAKLPNILIIGIDDLRPELNCYGATHIHSPNIDRLAERGTLFNHAYAQYAVCGPSRSSMFTSLRPDSTKAYNNKTHFRDNQPKAESLPEFFKNRGYSTYGFGKVLHNTHRDAQSWSEPQHYLVEKQYASPDYKDKRAGIDGIHESNKLIPLFEAPDVDDDAYRDGETNLFAIAKLKSAAKSEIPFLLFVGYHKPHTPFNAPRKYWDLYDPETLPLASNPYPPRGAPEFAVSPWNYVRSFGGMPAEGPLSEALARQTRQAYFACVSYIDSLIGELLAALEETGEADNTIIALWSDHGYQLGDHGMWCKHTNFETSTRIPFIVVDPREKDHGQRTHARVELIDMYPTLVDLAGFDSPPRIEGKSLVPLMVDPRAWDNQDTVAFSQFHRSGNRGYSVRTQNFRYTEWRSANTGTIVAQELYDHRSDPQENLNVANSPEREEQLRYAQSRLHQQWPLE
jgi:arylsulfatase A-like enzyme